MQSQATLLPRPLAFLSRHGHFPCPLQADLAHVRVIRPAVAESTAVGAAYAAGLAVGVWSGTDQLRAQWKAASEWTPSMPKAVVAASVRRWDVAVRRWVGLLLSLLERKGRGGHGPIIMLCL